MLSKSGQITIFVIISVMIVLGIGAYYFISKDIGEKYTKDEKLVVMKDNIDECLKGVYESALVQIGLQGGYANVTNGAFNGYNMVPYYYRKGKVTSPDLKEVENELSTLVDIGIGYCFDLNREVASLDSLNFSFKRIHEIDEDYLGYDFSYKDHSTDVKIEENKVIFIPNVQLSINSPNDGNYIIDFSESSSAIESDLFHMLEISGYYSSSLKDEETVCLSCVADMAKKEGLKVDVMPALNNESELVIISNNATSYPYIFEFANQYKGGYDYGF